MLESLSDFIEGMIDNDYRWESEAASVNTHTSASEEFRREFRRISRTSLNAYWVITARGKRYLIINGIGEGWQPGEVKRGRPFYWTEAEDFLLEALYPRHGAARVVKEIQANIGYARSIESVRQRAIYLKCKFKRRRGESGPGQ